MFRGLWVVLEGRGAFALPPAGEALAALAFLGGDLIEITRRDAAVHRAAEVFHRRSENLPSLRHELDLAIRLELDHLPSARKTR